MITLNGNNPDLLGLSTDTKPTDAGVNTLFLEVDSAKFYYFTGEDWVELGTAPDADDLGKGAPKLTMAAAPEETTDEPEQLETVEEEPVVEVKKTTTTRKRKTTEEVTEDGESK